MHCVTESINKSFNSFTMPTANSSISNPQSLKNDFPSIVSNCKKSVEILNETSTSYKYPNARRSLLKNRNDMFGKIPPYLGTLTFNKNNSSNTEKTEPRVSLKNSTLFNSVYGFKRAMAYTCVRVSFEIGHQSSIRNKSTPEGFTHDWEIFVRGAENTNISHYVEKVVFHLHETFSEPRRVIKEPPYSVKESGYAGFNLPIDIYFKGHEKPKKLNYNYDLDLQPSGPPIKRVTTEKYIFKNPSEDLRRKLIRGGGVGVVGSDMSGHNTLPEGSPQTTISRQTGQNALAAQNNMIPSVAKPKLSIEPGKKIPKPKVEVNQGSNNFSDLFGPPIKKVSPDSKKPSSSPKVPPSPKNKIDKSSSSDRSSEKVKYSKHHHKEKDKEKDDGERNTSSSRDKDRSKEKEKKEKGAKRSSSPPKPRPISPKRTSSPKRPPTPPIRRAPSPKHSPSKRPQTPTKHVTKQEKDDSKRLSDETKFREAKGEQKSDKDKKKKDRRSKDEKSSREKHKEKDHEKTPKIEKKDIKEEKKIKEKEPPKEDKPKEKEKPSNEKDKSRHKHKKKRHEEEKKDKHDKEKTKKEVKSDSKEKNGLHNETTLKAPIVPSPIRPPPQPDIEKQNRNPLKKLYDEMSDPTSSDSNQSNSLDEIIDIQPSKPVKAKVEEVVEKVVHKADTSERNNNNTKVKKEKVSSKKKEKKEVSKKDVSNKEEKDSRKRKKKTTTKLKEDDEKETKIIKVEIEEPKPEPKTCSKSVQYEPTPMETGSEDEEGEIASHDDSVEEESIEENKQEISENSPVAANNTEVLSSGNPDYLTQLKELQHKIMTLDDSVELQRLVGVITETGQYEITNQTFDFDLCALDRNTVKRLQEFFAAS